MDKFGIFKLLNSFFNLNTQKNPDTQSESASKSLDTNDLLTKLLSGINNNQNNTAPTPPNPKPQQKPSPPLQSDMLRTMHSHDEFIKRVKQKKH